MKDLIETYIAPYNWLGKLTFQDGDWGPKGEIISIAQQLKYPLLPMSDSSVVADEELLTREGLKLGSLPIPTGLRYELALDKDTFPKLLILIRSIKHQTDKPHVYELCSLAANPGDTSYKLTITVTDSIVCRLTKAEWVPTYDIKNEFAGWEQNG